MMASQNAEPAQPLQHRDLWPGIAGLAAGGLLIAGYVLWSFTPDVTGTGALRTVVLWYLKESNQDQSEAMALILLAAGLLFLFFLVALSRLAGNRSHWCWWAARSSRRSCWSRRSPGTSSRSR